MLTKDSIVSGALNVVSNHYVKEHCGGNTLIEIRDNFKYSLDRHVTPSNLYSPADLLKVICNALEISTKGKPNNLVLLLSTGKDSVGLALGFAELGVSVDTLSLVSDDAEAELIGSFAKQLGHRSHIIHASDIEKRFDEKFLRNLDYDRVCFDQAIMFFEIMLDLAQIGKDVTLIDGMGNDISFGHIPSLNQIRSFKLGSALKSINIQNYWARDFKQAMGVSTALRYFLNSETRNALESRFPSLLGKYDPKITSIQSLFSERAFVRGIFLDEYQYAEKTRILGKKLNVEVVFPWSDESLSNFVFNLPENQKFNSKKLINKLLLRELLFDKLNYDQPKVGINIYEKIAVDYSDLLKSMRFFNENFIWAIQNKALLSNSTKKRAMLEAMLFASYLRGLPEYRRELPELGGIFL